MDDWRIITGNALEIMGTIEEKSVQCCVTSPPYWGVRRYECPDASWEDGWSGQLGLETTPAEYVKHLCDVFDGVGRVLRDDGVLWIVIGYNNACVHTVGSPTPKYKALLGAFGANCPKMVVDESVTGYRQGEIVPVPWMLAAELRARGWFHRADVIWHKTRGRPSLLSRRPRFAHEMILMLTKSMDYYYDDWGLAAEVGQVRCDLKPHQLDEARAERIYSLAKSVWSLPTSQDTSTHVAPFPIQIPRRCIAASTHREDLVLDPFCGTSTTGIAALELGRRFVGLEIGPGYAQEARVRMEACVERLGGVSRETKASGRQIGLFPVVESP